MSFSEQGSVSADLPEVKENLSKQLLRCSSGNRSGKLPRHLPLLAKRNWLSRDSEMF